MERAKPVIPANEAYLAGTKTGASLFLPNPFLTGIVFTLLTTVMLVFFLVALRGLLLGAELNSSGKRVNGVVDFLETYRKKNGEAYRITYTYTIEGVARTNTDSDISPSRGAGLAPKSPVPVVYSANNPSRAKLGTPGNLWSQTQGMQGVLLALSACGTLFTLFYAVKSYREVALHRKLHKDGRVVLAETLSSQATKGHKGQIKTVITYRLPPEASSAVGSATYTSTNSSAVRCPRSGEKLAVLYCSTDIHRPL